MPRLAYGRLYAHQCIAKSRAVRARQKEIVRAGLDCKVDPALFGETDMRQRKPRALVGDMHLAAGPFGKNRRAADGLDCRHVHMLGEVRGGVGLTDQAVDAKINQGLPLGNDFLLQQSLHRCCRRISVGHVEDRGNAADGSSLCRARPGLLVGETGLAEMNVDVDGAGQNKETLGVYALARGRHVIVASDQDDAAAVDGNGGLGDAPRADQLAAGDDGINFLRHQGTSSAISPATAKRSSLRVRSDAVIAFTSRTSASTSKRVGQPFCTTTSPATSTVSTDFPVSANTS